MSKGKNNNNLNEGTYRFSVLDTLLNRSISQRYKDDSLSDLRTVYSDSDRDSHRISSPSSQKLSENGVTNSTIESPMFPETRTPTTRSQQLPILLARNYYTAPACLLRFVNTSSTIKSYSPKKRDSDGTVIDSQFEPIIDCNLDTNDEMDNFKMDDFPETFSIGTMTNRTSLMSDQHFCDTEDLPFLGVDPVDLNLVLQNVKSKSNPHFDKGCSPFLGPKSRKSTSEPKFTFDKATSPMLMKDSVTLENRISNNNQDSKVNPVEDVNSKINEEIVSNLKVEPMEEVISTNEKEQVSELKPESTELDSYVYEQESKNLGTTDVGPDENFQGSEFPIEKISNSPEYSTLEYGDFSFKKPQMSTERKIPVYCRSLLYRIRVPLSKRLKNVDEEVLSRSMSSPPITGSRSNLSCDRLYSRRSSLTNSVESRFSVLRMSDLDSNSADSLKNSSLSTHSSRLSSQINSSILSKDFKPRPSKESNSKIQVNLNSTFPTRFESTLSKDSNHRVSSNFDTRLSKQLETSLSKELQSRVSRELEPRTLKQSDYKVSRELDSRIPRAPYSKVSTELNSRFSKETSKIRHTTRAHRNPKRDFRSLANPDHRNMDIQEPRIARKRATRTRRQSTI